MIDLISNTGLEKKVYYFLQTFFEEKNLELIKVIYSEGKNSKLELYLDKPEGRLTVDECALITKEVSYLLDVENIVKGFYRLEISSPGIDRSLTRLADFSKYKNFAIKVFKEKSIIKGKLVGHSEDDINLNNKNGLSKISLSEINDIKIDLDKLSFDNLKRMESL